MNKTYEPDKEYLDRLEWQLSSEYRRTNNLGAAPKKIAVPRSLLAVAIIIGVLTTSVTVVKAAEYFQDSWKKKIEIARIETDVMLKQAHLESTTEIVAQSEERFSMGLIEEEEYRVMEFALKQTELALEKSLLNLDEVVATGEIPRNELYAPVIGSRDYVTERLNIDKEMAALDLEQHQSSLKRVKQRVALGLINPDHLTQMQAGMSAERSAQEMQIEEIQNRLALRNRFLAGEISVRETEIAGRITVAERNLLQAKMRIEFLEGQMKRMKTLESQGIVSPLQLTQLQYGLDAARAELKLATLEMTVLKEAR